MNYCTVITKVGTMARELLEAGILIIFNENAPETIAEVCYMHPPVSLEDEVKTGDVVILGQEDYLVTEVGSEANTTLKELGHCSFCFDEEREILPGMIRLKGENYPKLRQGDSVVIIFT